MKALIIDDVHSILIEKFQNFGIEVDYQPDIGQDSIGDIIGDYDILILRSKISLTQSLIDKAASLKIIGRCGAGMDNIDVEYARIKGIKSFSANEGNQDSVAEHTVGFILTMLHRIFKGHSQVSHFVWDRESNRGEELNQKTVGLIGYGYMGKAVAKRLKSFECRVIVYDKYLQNYGDEFAEEVDMDTIKKESDIVSLHIPLTDETKYLYDDEMFGSFVKPIYFINTSRGKIVSLQGLSKAIQEGKVQRAALDVLENEKFDDLNESDMKVLQQLYETNRVIITPHVAGWSVESYEKLADVLADKIINDINAN